MTSLIDVIFLLLLFFMLSSTFSKFSEIELTAGGSGPGRAAETPPLMAAGWVKFSLWVRRVPSVFNVDLLLMGYGFSVGFQKKYLTAQ